MLRRCFASPLPLRTAATAAFSSAFSVAPSIVAVSRRHFGDGSDGSTRVEVVGFSYCPAFPPRSRMLSQRHAQPNDECDSASSAPSFAELQAARQRVRSSFETLGFTEPVLDVAAIKAAFRKRAFESHPDAAAAATTTTTASSSSSSSTPLGTERVDFSSLRTALQECLQWARQQHVAGSTSCPNDAVSGGGSDDESYAALLQRRDAVVGAVSCVESRSAAALLQQHFAAANELLSSSSQHAAQDVLRRLSVAEKESCRYALSVAESIVRRRQLALVASTAAEALRRDAETRHLVDHLERALDDEWSVSVFGSGPTAGTVVDAGPESPLRTTVMRFVDLVLETKLGFAPRPEGKPPASSAMRGSTVLFDERKRLLVASIDADYKQLADALAHDVQQAADAVVTILHRYASSAAAAAATTATRNPKLLSRCKKRARSKTTAVPPQQAPMTMADVKREILQVMGLAAEPPRSTEQRRVPARGASKKLLTRRSSKASVAVAAPSRTVPASKIIARLQQNGFVQEAAVLDSVAMMGLRESLARADFEADAHISELLDQATMPEAALRDYAERTVKPSRSADVLDRLPLSLEAYKKRNKLT